MKKSVWKYTLDVKRNLYMPDGSEIIAVQGQRGDVYLWALVDPYADMVPRRFAIHETDSPFDSSSEYIGTAFLHNGYLVLHVFEERA